MKAYSPDLREKVLNAYLNKEGTVNQPGERFRVSVTFVFNPVKRFRVNGRIRPDPHGGRENGTGKYGRLQIY